MKHLVIIGNGIAGVTIARHVRKKSDMKITIISAESDHFFSRTALMYIYMGHLKYEQTKPYEDWFWEKNKINLVRGFVEKIDTDKKELSLDEARKITYDILVIATGSESNKFGWPGQDLPGVQGLYSLQDLGLLDDNSINISRAVLVGGGLIGIELAEMLASRGIPITFLVREEYFWNLILAENEAKLVSRHILEHGIDLRLSTELQEILPGEDGRVKSVITNQNEEIPCQFVGLTVGVHPNISIVKDSKIRTGRGVLVNDYLETNIENVYAAGDCAEIITPEDEKNRVEQLWYTGRMQGIALARTICGERTTYDRGIWFNSAKFFDIEYQTYGFVSNSSQPGEKSFYWEDKSGKKCLHIVYDENTSAVKGINVFGIRLRHKVCEQWIRDNITIDNVLSHLPDANFDPEFFKKHESEIIETFNRENPHNKIQLIPKRNFIQRAPSIMSKII
jgi:NAD(P)H-nitrite reductase large subunit